MAMKKISLVTFSYLSSDSFGPSGEALSIARKLHDNGLLHRIICPGSKNIVTLPTDVFRSPPGAFFYKTINKWCSVLQLSQEKTRFVKERIFDHFVSRDKDLLESDLVLFLKPAFPQSARQLHLAGKTVVAWASILHPEFNYQQMLHEEKNTVPVHPHLTPIKSVSNI